VKWITIVDKTVRKGTSPEKQQAEAFRYWQSLDVGDRLSAVWDASEAAYAFAAAFKGVPVDDAQGSERAVPSTIRPLSTSSWEVTLLAFTQNHERRKIWTSSSGVTKKTAKLYFARSHSTVHRSPA
jgi:hypothetical protein